MKSFTIKVPNNCTPSVLGFTTLLMESAQEYTSEEIQVKTDTSAFVDAKSIMGLTSVRFSQAKEITVQVMGEMEEYCAPRLEKKLMRVLEVFIHE